MRIFFSAGEPSGDHHAALLIKAIRKINPKVECNGLGGPQMAAAGCHLIDDLTALAVMWVSRVILNIHRFFEFIRRAERSFIDHRPDVVVLIDYPGFHWWLAWRAKRHGIPVIFYCPPQIWAWASWRIGKMRRLIDHVLSALPFEHAWFASQGLKSSLVGHPFFDGWKAETIVRPAHRMLLLLPGSRRQEIDANLESILEATTIIQSQVQDLEVVVGAFCDRHAKQIQQAIARRGLALRIEVGRTQNLIAQAHAAIAVSGSVSLELLAARVPTVILYRTTTIGWIIQSWFRHAKWITLVNLLACREPIVPLQRRITVPKTVERADPENVFPEYLVVLDPSVRLAEHVVEWFQNEKKRSLVIDRLDQIAKEIGQSGSAEKAAYYIVDVAKSIQETFTETRINVSVQTSTIERAA